MASNRIAMARLKQLLELRAGFEFAAGVAALPWLRLAPTGDGHSVLVIPGLVTSDISTQLLRNVLTSLGYDVHGWGLGRNYGLRPGLEAKMLGTMRRLCERSGRKLSLIGHSIGGTYARMLAAERPEEVRTVITLGCPLTEPRASNVGRTYAFTPGESSTSMKLWEQARATPLVPTTSIYSRTDGLVPWRSSIQGSSAHTENVEVVSSHIGMAVHPMVLYIITERLAQIEGQWRPFTQYRFAPPNGPMKSSRPEIGD